LHCSFKAIFGDKPKSINATTLRPNSILRPRMTSCATLYTLHSTESKKFYA